MVLRRRGRCGAQDPMSSEIDEDENFVNPCSGKLICVHSIVMLHAHAEGVPVSALRAYRACAGKVVLVHARMRDRLFRYRAAQTVIQIELL